MRSSQEILDKIRSDIYRQTMIAQEGNWNDEVKSQIWAVAQSLGNLEEWIKTEPLGTSSREEKAAIDLDEARSGIEKVGQAISKCMNTNRTPDDLFELGVAIGQTRVALGLPSYAVTDTPDAKGGE